MEEKQQHPRVSVVIPVLNEAQNLRYVLPYIPYDVHEVILIDGHSTDDTVVIARQLFPSIHVVQQTGKGKGDALSCGFLHCTGDIIVMLDGDGSTHPGEIPYFIEALLKGNDFAKGSRFLKGGGSSDITLLRRLGNFGLSSLVNLFFLTHFSDLCYGYNAFWRYCLDHIAIDGSGFEVETLIHLQVHHARMKIVEIPSFEQARIHGISKLHTFRDGWRVLHVIINELLRRAHLPFHSHKLSPPYHTTGSAVREVTQE